MAKELSAVLEAPYRLVLKEFDIPSVKGEAFLLRVEMVSICGGDPIEYEGRNRKVHYPLILGHEMVGFVEEVGEEAAATYGIQKGDRVTVEPYIACGRCQYCLSGFYQFCTRSRVYGVNVSCQDPPHLWGAYGQFMYVAPGSRVHKVDPAVPAAAACLSPVLGNGVRWVRTKARVKFGESVVVIGVGAQGLATIIAAREAGAKPIIAAGKTRNPEKWDLAREFGADYLVDTSQEDAITAVRRLTGGQGADVVVETTGVSAMMQLGLELARPAGRYILVGTNGFSETPLVSDLVVFKELEVIGGLGQSLDTEEAVKIINSRRYRLEKLITHVFPLEQADEAIKFYIRGGSTVNRVAIRP